MGGFIHEVQTKVSSESLGVELYFTGESLMVDILKEELQLVPLGPTGGTTIIPFKEMANIKQDDREFSVDIDWASSSLVTDPEDTSSMQRVTLDTTDEQSLDSIIAALCMKDRVGPGDDVSGPPESEDSEGEQFLEEVLPDLPDGLRA